MYEAGYKAGRTACLSLGSATEAASILEAKPDVDSAYAVGFEWAMWDYNDANGLSNDRVVRRA